MAMRVCELRTLEGRPTAFHYELLISREARNLSACEIPKILSRVNPIFPKVLWAKFNRSVGVIQPISESPPFAKEGIPLKHHVQAEANYSKGELSSHPHFLL